MRVSPLRLALALLLCGALLGVRAVRLHAQTPLDAVDWAALIAADPHVQQPPWTNTPSIPGLGVYSVVRDQGVELDGFPMLSAVQFGDLDSDGLDEAVIPFFGAGASGGVLGFVIFQQTAGAPALVWVDSEYAALRSIAIDHKADGDALAVTRPGFVGFEPILAPSSLVTTAYTLMTAGLLELSESVAPSDNQDVTVAAFYQALNERRFADAYAFLGPDFTAAHPYDAWLAGYASTVSIAVTVQRHEDDPSLVSVAISAVDRVTDGETTIEHFGGTWRLIFDAAQRRWLLDAAAITPTN